MSDGRRAAALASAREVADAVLYEGYVLFPYRASAQKNRYRWQFGVVIPEAQAQAGTAEPAEVVSRCLLRGPRSATVTCTARFLRVRRRQVERRAGAGFEPVEELEAGDELHTSWDEGLEREVAVGPVPLAAVLARPERVPIDLPQERATEMIVDAAGAAVGRIERTAEAVAGVVEVTARAVDGDVVVLESVVRNRTGWAEPAAPREEVLRRSLVGLHLLLVADGATFASLTDPPAWAAPWAAGLENRHTHPVLASPADDVVLSAPIILSDHPAVAAESAGESYDATEIDELLTLAVRALTPAEKRAARATDPRAAALVERADTLPPAVLERLHGAVRRFERLRDPVADDRAATVEEELDAFFGVGEDPPQRVEVDGRVLAVGDRVRLAPRRRADAQDLFTAGRPARVERIETDVEGQVHLAVTLTDDPGADLHAWSRRFLYYQPDEVEVLD